ncbi:MAG: choice-of-anchor D domain-containing protein [Bacteroidales bacterium]|nr:choice-of-anchor D domain-containing protein [Bacteroidales bacterium]
MKPVNLLRSATAAVALALLCPLVCGQAPAVQSVDSGNKLAMFVEADGQAHLVYTRDNNLWYATKTRSETEWQIRDLGSCSDINDIAVAMTPDRRLHVVCARYNYDWNVENRGRLMYGKLQPSGDFSLKQIRASRVEFNSLALDGTTDGEVYLAYIWGSASPHPIMIRKTSGGEWQEDVLVYSTGYKCVDLDVDSDNNVHLSFYDLSGGGILYNFRTGDEAGPIEKIEPDWSGGQMETLVTSVTVNSLNEPFVSYVGSIEGDYLENLKYASKKDGKWSYWKVDTGTSTGTPNKLVITPSGVPGFGYIHNPSDPDQVRYSEKEGETWHRKNVDPFTGWATEIETETDNNGYIHMAWYAGDVRYALLQPLVLLTSDPDLLDFGVPATNESRTLPLTLKNISDRTVTVDNITINDPRFSFSTTSFSLQSQAEQTVQVTFNQTGTAGIKTFLQVVYDGTESKVIDIPVTVRRTGPALATDPGSVSFVNVPEEELASQVITLMNTGNSNLEISKIELRRDLMPGMPVPTDFKLVEPHSCTLLGPGENCTLTITFQPGLVSSESYQYTYLNIASNDPETPLKKITVSGTMAVPSIWIQDSSLDLGYASVGHTVEKQLRVSNWGGGELHVTSTPVTGTDANQFSCVNTCTTIEGGGICYLTVRMTPTVTGDFTATLTVNSDSYSITTRSIKVALTGTSRERRLELSPADIEFGQVEVDASATQVLTLNNPGANEVKLKGLLLSGINPEEFSYDEQSCASIAPASSCNILVSFSPLFEGNKSAVLTVQSDDSDQPEQQVMLSGNTGTTVANSLAGDLWNENSSDHVNKANVILYAEGSDSEVSTLNLEGTYSYKFTDLTAGKYTVKAVADLAVFPGTMPTYLGDKPLLSEATYADVAGEVTGKDIHILNVPPPGTGAGTIEGKMESGSGKGAKVTNTAGGNKGDPVNGTRVFLRGTADGKIKAFDVTASDGSFEFTGMANGTYLFLADHHGLPMNTINPQLVISDAERNIDILVTASADKITVEKIATGIRDVNAGDLMIYPVPASDRIFIVIPDMAVNDRGYTLNIHDCAGMIMSSVKLVIAGGNTASVDVGYLAPGMYIFELCNEQNCLKQKIVITR